MKSNSNYARRALQDRLRASNVQLLADIEQRRAFTAEHGEVTWPSPQDEPMAETSPQQPPAAYREMSAEERAPWDAWLQSAIDAFRDEVQTSVSAGFEERDALIDKLQREVDVLTSRANKSWWSK